MPDKLTDKEIVKALEEAIEYGCGHYREIEMPTIKNALDLINRQDEKMQSLQAENERLKDYVNTVEKEVDWYKDELRHSDKKVATKAYKEVFEKLNDKAIVTKMKLYGNWFILKGVTLHDINTLKKELVGE